jgi:ubiquinone/menaquinone biosynthesis C-methylase UbiE
MPPSSDAPQSSPTTSSALPDGALPRLFNFDLPALKQTGQAFAEQTDRSAIRRVLDIASGTGAWTISAAQAHPEVQFVGIERSPQLVEQARAQAHAHQLENISFTVMDPFGSLDLPEAPFDLVNARYLLGQLLTEAWPQALRTFMRMVRPGGIIRLTEAELPISSSTAYAQLGGLISQALFQTKRSFSPTGRLLSVTPVLKRLLQDAGCQQVRYVVAEVNFSAGMPAHEELAQDITQTYRLVLPFLVAAAVTTQEEVEQIYQQMLTELTSERFDAVAYSLIAWGIKP